MAKTKKRLIALQVLKVSILFIPILTVLGFNAPQYFTQEQGYLLPQGYELTLGGMFAFLLAGSFMLGKTDILKGSKLWWVLLVLFVLLDSIIDDGILILFTIALSQTVGNLLTSPINNLKMQLGYENQARASAEANKIVYKDMITNQVERSGRV
ncbi:MAG: hypothetical protein EOL97_14310 [Spirochaetia bacterium]|nr:hypothetical protein [Spirochaetia bacterium]